MVIVYIHYVILLWFITMWLLNGWMFINYTSFTLVEHSTTTWISYDMISYGYHNNGTVTNKNKLNQRK